MSSDIKYWYLRDHKLFSTLNNGQIQDLCVITRFKQAKKGEIIYLPDEPLGRIYFLKKGLIKIAQVDESGNEAIKDIIRKGDIFGELAFGDGRLNQEYAEALSKDVIICSFRVEDFEKVLRDDTSIAFHYTKLIGLKFKRLNNLYTNLIFRDVRSRLVYFLRDWAEKEGKEKEGSIFIDNYLTHQDIARLVCSSRQTVTQVLNELEQEGVLQYSRKSIQLNQGMLQALT